MGGPVFSQPVEGVDNGVKKFGVKGFSDLNSGVYGLTNRGYAGVHGVSSYTGVGVRAWSYAGHGLISWSFGSRSIGVDGANPFSIGVRGWSDSGVGVHGICASGPGVLAVSDDSYGVRAYSEQSIGVDAWGYPGVYGSSDYGPGVVGRSNSSHGVAGYSSSGYGIYGRTFSGLAALLDGNVRINGDVHVTGKINKAAVQFKIDHPLDPANKYLYHSCVESPDMKNVYDGVVALDDKGESEIDLPDWFGALNKDFRYQLTAIGAPGPNLYIAEEISDTTTTTNYGSSGSRNNNNNSRFKIAEGTSGMKVSWQVTGIRKDPYANAHRIQVEEDKPDKERGYYLHPDLYSQPEEMGISHLFFPKEEEKPQLIINENKHSNL